MAAPPPPQAPRGFALLLSSCQISVPIALAQHARLGARFTLTLHGAGEHQQGRALGPSYRTQRVLSVSQSSALAP